MQVQVRVDEEGALRNGRFAFSNRYTLITELLQNARRAGATSIDVEYDEEAKTLRVSDDGSGVEDFQALLTINKSGWDEETKAEELPFGVGFSKCLYSATRVIVTSRGQRIDFETEAALAQAVIDVVEVEGTPGTIVELHGVELPHAIVEVRRLVRGFAIPVRFNDENLERPYAIDAVGLQFVDSDIGKVHLAGHRTGDHSMFDVVLLQGFCVIDDYPWERSGHVNVIHLDSTKFTARLPDRDKLIDEAEQKRRIASALKSLWREILEERKHILDASEFCTSYFKAASSFGLADVFDDVPLLPAEVCDRISDYPYQSESGNPDYLTRMEMHVPKEDVESGGVRLCELDDPNEENVLVWMFARATGHLVVSAGLLGSNHWAHAYVTAFEDVVVNAEPNKVFKQAAFDGEWVWGKVLLCDSYTVTVNGESAEIVDDATVCDGRIFVPKGDHSGQVCLQMSNYMDDNHWQEAIQCADIYSFATFVRRLRAVDPEQTIREMLQELGLEKYPVLQGKSFHLTVGDAPEKVTLELVA